MMFLTRIFCALIAYAASMLVFGFIYGAVFDEISVGTPVLLLFLSLYPLLWFIWAGFALTYLASISLSQVNDGWFLSSGRMALGGLASGVGTTSLLVATSHNAHGYPALSAWRGVPFVLAAGVAGSFGWWLSALVNNAIARSRLPKPEGAGLS
jgi:hypothetical protein